MSSRPSRPATAAAAAARAAAAQQQQRRERVIRAVGIVVVLAVLAGIVFLFVRSRANAPAPVPTDSSAPLPAGVMPATGAQPYGWTYRWTPGAPVLQLWEDFQCPVCGQLERQNGAAIEALADAGKVTLVYRPATFLDLNLRNGSSNRAVAAWGCAIDAGRGIEYHNAVFAAQPAREGDGFTDQQLVAFGTTAGITGAARDTFDRCVAAGTYRSWPANSQAQFEYDGIAGTPTAVLNGTELPRQTLFDMTALTAAVAAAGPGTTATPAGTPSSSVSPS
ncbi:MAG: hypothetical protein EPO13_01235 [Actinomycetota bacterium]|nr:MAG: hypothetical protein EPO13_01235 [Actinomycetota bacterium]